MPCFDNVSNKVAELQIVHNSYCVLLSVKKRKSKTPAQDRLQKFLDKNATAVIDSVKEVAKSAHPAKTRTSTINGPIAKKSLFAPKRSGDKKPTSNGNNKSATDGGAHDDIPVLFPPKNFAQERLRALQTSLCIESGIENSSFGRGSDHDATQVFGDTFGIESGNPMATCAANMDEEMDWEPCEDSTYTFQQLESMAVDVLTDSAYIIPDTNVFLDSLASIRSVISKGSLSYSNVDKKCRFVLKTNKILDFPECKYNMLIPFVVLQELDQLKRRNGDDNSVSARASRAIRYIYDELKSKNPRLQGNCDFPDHH